MSEHYTEGRRYSHISQAWILEASWNDQEEIAYLRSQVAELTAQRKLLSQYVYAEEGLFTFPDGDTIDVKTGPSHADLTAKLKAKDSALEFAKAAIGDAIYLEDGLDGETGQRVQRLIVQALALLALPVVDGEIVCDSRFVSYVQYCRAQRLEFPTAAQAESYAALLRLAQKMMK